MFGVGHWDCRYKPRRNEDGEEKKTDSTFSFFVIFVACGLYQSLPWKSNE
jgi:hypothetical protein